MLSPHPMPAFIDLTGRVFGRLTVLSCAQRGGRAPLRWHCRCTCGATLSVLGCSLTSGNTKSCGCLHLERVRSRRTIPVEHKPTWETWRHMISRCCNPTSHAWQRYGGRGLTVCDRWLDFANFLADMGVRPEGQSIERKKNDVGYCPENCVWADTRTQQRNRRNTVYITVCGKRTPLIAACEEYGISYKSVYDRRLRTGTTLTEAFFDTLDKNFNQAAPC
jgi:hypothetical protein